MSENIEAIIVPEDSAYTVVNGELCQHALLRNDAGEIRFHAEPDCSVDWTRGVEDEDRPRMIRIAAALGLHDTAFSSR